MTDAGLLTSLEIPSDMLQCVNRVVFTDLTEDGRLEERKGQDRSRGRQRDKRR